MLTRTVRAAAVQAEPVWFDMDATADKAVSIFDEAGRAGAEVIAFPEAFIPGYPWQIWLDSPAANMPLVPRYLMNSPTVDGPQLAKIADAAKRNEITVSMGYSERDSGTLYLAQAVFDPAGELVQARRKLKPTHVERTVYGEGDGSDLDVVDLEFGKVGGLCCWEHLQPLSKYAMYSMGEDIHCAAWPSFSIYPGAAQALSPEVNTAASRMYAVEGQVFVLAACGLIGDAGVEFFCDTDTKKALLTRGGGFARIYGPEGSDLAEPLAEDEEGILYADCDPALQAIAKSAADPAGHYSRPDVTQLLLHRSPTPPVVTRGQHAARNDERVTREHVQDRTEDDAIVVPESVKATAEA
ncbi:carbon-nitrogen hydrolase family protein [Nitriliruptor alkaliphilus]|uniref:carbon-nitrogen hydrolase family protein n=1 Tax=Nitriliruptor alkaliphilus TaxID=427918 RepID=UPI0009F8143D|nr:carbon-nitrogen hydrolase family protein [Nitriliruptor alkaliphilus]